MPNMQAHKIASATCPAKNGAPVIKIAVKMAMLTRNKIKPKDTLVICSILIFKINKASLAPAIGRVNKKMRIIQIIFGRRPRTVHAPIYKA